MYEAARVNASIELLAECQAVWAQEKPLPADIIINRYFRSRRYIGSKDRGAIAALLYLVIRNLSALKWHARSEDARSLALAVLLLIQKKTLPDVHNIFNGEHFSASKLTPAEKELVNRLAGKSLSDDTMPDATCYNYPESLDSLIKESLGEHWQKELEALNQEASVDLRTNTLLTSRDALLEGLKAEQFEVEPAPLSEIGIRLRTRAPVFTSQYFKQGWFEMQDEGSQIASHMLNARAGQKIIDFCAGAGGKTLAIAAMMKNKGRILAWDTSKNRIEQMRERLKRAKVDNVQIHILESEQDSFLKRHRDSADGVIVDAPCSGSGTWRRNPDLKWRQTPGDIAELIEIQKNILHNAARLVKVNGHLLYITCSIFKSENESQVEAFLQQHENFKVVTPDNLCLKLTQKVSGAGGYLRLSPYQDGTDGFFAVLLKRL